MAAKCQTCHKGLKFSVRRYPPRPSASVDNTLLDLQNSSYPTQPHSVIAKYTFAPYIPMYTSSYEVSG